MTRTVMATLLLFATLVVFLPPAQAAEKIFYETIAVQGDGADFSSHGMLDLVAAYWAELSPYNPRGDVTSDLLVLRVEVRSFAEAFTCEVRDREATIPWCFFRYHTHFRHGERTITAFVELAPPGNGACCSVSNASHGGRVTTDLNSISFFYNRTALGLLPGQTLDQLYVTSSLRVQDQFRAADRMPGDNGQLPYDQKPELAGLYAPAYTLAGTFPFFQVEALTATVENSAGGDPVRFNFRITPVKELLEDTMRFRFDRPPGWSVTPSRGTTGPDPTGLLTGISHTSPGEFAFTAFPNGIVEPGEVYTIGMRVHSASQGFALVPTHVRITGPAIEDPNYVFQLRSAGSLQAGKTSHFEFVVLDAAGAPRLGLPVEVWFWKGERRMAALPAVERDGAYAVDYKFPSGGTWTVEPRLAEARPAPHGVFTVDVREAGAPGPGWILALAAAVGALALARRPR